MNNGYSVFQVGRAFSFNKTPSKLKRAVSTVISPLTSSAKLNRSQVQGHLGTPGEHGMEYRPEVSLTFHPSLLFSIPAQYDSLSVERCQRLSPGGSSVASAPHTQLILGSRVSPASSLVSLNSDLSGAVMAASGSPGSYQARARQVSPYNYSGADTVSWACRAGGAVSASVENINKLDTRSEVHIFTFRNQCFFFLFFLIKSSKI